MVKKLKKEKRWFRTHENTNDLRKRQFTKIRKSNYQAEN